MLPSAGRLAIALSLCLFLGGKSVRAQTSEPFKPYIVLALDVSGSMDTATGAGPPSCGGEDTRMDHAKCAIANISNAYGDVVLALGRFRTFGTAQTNSDSTGATCGSCSSFGIDCDSVGNGGIGSNSLIGRSGDRFEVLVPLIDDSNPDIQLWNNNLCSGDCTTDPEILNAGYTPLAGTLNGAKRYWQGLDTPGTDPDVGVQPYWTGTGDDPIRDDLLNDIFITNVDSDRDGDFDSDSQCRPYIVILLTDGAETCAPFSETTAAASSLLVTSVDALDYRIETKPIGFGISPGDFEIESIANAGGAGQTSRPENTPASATLSYDGAGSWSDNATVTIGSVTYTLEDDGLNAANEILVGGSIAATLANLAAAINDSGVEGTNYGPGTVVHPQVSASVSGTVLTITTKGGDDCTGLTYTLSSNDGDMDWSSGVLPTGGYCGFYATSEADLSIALGNIIEDSLRFEKCNGLDDDCDGEIDEDFKAPLLSPGLGDGCNDGEFGACRDTGVYECSASQLGVTCDAVDDEANPPQSAEVCNFADDDCDNKIDEAPASCVGCLPVETCNGRDDNCNGICDEGLTRVCGSDIGDCELGDQTCIQEVDGDGDRICDNTADWGPCDDVGPEVEDCNGEDDDCDGTVDGFTEDCTSMPDPPGNPNVGICHPGQRTCPSDGTGWTPCIGEVVPDPLDPDDVSCDGLDNNCNDEIDEGFTPSNCSSACGTGMTECTPLGIVCEDTQTPEPEVCDGFDNDCNGLVDDNITEPPSGEPCDDNGTLCLPGVWVCNASTGGEFECQGGVPPGMEICNCIDDNCNDVVDDGAICPPGQSCVNSGSFCQCAPPCMVGEFQCFAGRHCVDGFCLLDPCYMVDCPPVAGEAQACIDDGDDGDPDCVSACDPRVTMCPAPTVCRPTDGECVFDDCRGFPERCEEDELCVGGTCVSDPCSGVTCSGAGEYCAGGTCVASCSDVDCPSGQRCVLGECEPDPCGDSCPSGQVCEDSSGQCVDDPCQGRFCPQGEWCNPQTGDCEQDPCLGIECPNDGDVCEGGTCADPDDVTPDAGPDDRDYVAPGGGGGCSTSGGGASALLLLGLVLLIVRRRGGVR